MNSFIVLKGRRKKRIFYGQADRKWGGGGWKGPLHRTGLKKSIDDVVKNTDIKRLSKSANIDEGS